MEVRDSSRNVGANEKDKSIKLCEAKVPLSNIGSFKCYKLSKGFAENELAEVGRLFIRINRLESEILDAIPNSQFDYFPLYKVLPSNNPLYKHLYVDVNWSTDNFSYCGGLPGPIAGELAIDRYNNVEVCHLKNHHHF